MSTVCRHHAPTSGVCAQCFVAGTTYPPVHLIDFTRVIGYRIRIGSRWIVLHPTDVQLVMDEP